jgi:hypothetical protein
MQSAANQSPVKFPVMLRNTGNFFDLTGNLGQEVPILPVFPESCGQFPYDLEQGNYSGEQGITGQDQGMIKCV